MAYLLEQELRKVGAVLAGDTGDDGLLHWGSSFVHLGLLVLGLSHLSSKEDNT